jgi:oxaloacetate decarboxylase alpha subunit
LDRPRAKEFATWEPPQPSLAEVRSKLGGTGVSDEDLLMRYVVGKDEVDAMRAAGAPREYVSATKPVIALLENLARRSDCRQIYIQKDGFSVSLEKHAPGDAQLQR